MRETEEEPEEVIRKRTLPTMGEPPRPLVSLFVAVPNTICSCISIAPLIICTMHCSCQGWGCAHALDDGFFVADWNPDDH